MRRLLLGLVVLFALIPAGSALAAPGDDRIVLVGDVLVDRDETAGDVVVADGDVVIRGTVDGDVIVADGDVTIRARAARADGDGARRAASTTGAARAAPRSCTRWTASACASTSGCGPRGSTRRARWPPTRSRAGSCRSAASARSPARTSGRRHARDHDRPDAPHRRRARLAPRRGPASEAALLYEETADSIAERERLAAERRVAQPPKPDLGGRPTKRDRRRFESTHGARGGRR